MKLRRLQYEGFKSNRPVVIDTTAPVFVTGSNRSGKSGVIEMAKALVAGCIDAPVGHESDILRFSPTGEIQDTGQFQNGAGAWSVTRSWSARRSPQKEIAVNDQKLSFNEGTKAVEKRLGGFRPGLGFNALFGLSATERKRWLLSLFSPNETTVADMLGKFSDRFLHAVEAIPEEDFAKDEIAKRRVSFLARISDQISDSPFSRLAFIESTLRDEKNKAVQSARNKVKAVQEIMRSAAMTTRPVAGGATGIRAKIADLEKARDDLKEKLARLNASLESHQALYQERDEALEEIQELEAASTLPDDILDTEQEIEHLNERLAEIGDPAGRLRDLETAYARTEAQRNSVAERSQIRAGLEQSIREAEEEYARQERALVLQATFAARETELERLEAQLQEARDAVQQIALLNKARAGCALSVSRTRMALEFITLHEFGDDPEKNAPPSPICDACGSRGDFTEQIAALRKALAEEREEGDPAAFDARIAELEPIAGRVEALAQQASNLRAEISGMKDRDATRRETMDREEARLADLRAQLAAITPDEEGLDLEVERLTSEIETERGLVTETDAINELIAEQKQDLAVQRNNQTHHEARLKELTDTRDRLEKAIQELPSLDAGPMEAELKTVETDLAAKRQALEGQVEREKSEKDALRFNGEKTIEEAWAKIAGDLMEFVGPKGLMRELLEAAIRPLEADVTSLLQRAGFAGCKFAVRFFVGDSESCDIGVQRLDTFVSEINGDPNHGFIDYSAMSASEQLVYAACVAMGLAPRATAEWKPLFVKDLTLLVGEYRQLFVDLLTAESSRFDNVFIEEATEGDAPSVQVGETWNVVSMEGYNQWAE
ncbi:MAG: hypothetical protein M0R06_04835 [Sphaerochaeta sp.]|jgi:DNA repair exonuclease SbcCD ATPase subunit|nr:hypothetical protein [Sphaerochaeta sp.]